VGPLSEEQQQLINPPSQPQPTLPVSTAPSDPPLPQQAASIDLPLPQFPTPPPPSEDLDAGAQPSDDSDTPPSDNADPIADFIVGGATSVLDDLYARAKTRPDGGVGPTELPPGGTDYSAGVEGGLLSDPIMRQLTGFAANALAGELMAKGLGLVGSEFPGLGQRFGLGKLGGTAQSARFNFTIADAQPVVQLPNLNIDMDTLPSLPADTVPTLGPEIDDAPAPVELAGPGEIFDDFSVDNMSEEAAAHQERAGGLPSGKGYYVIGPDGIPVQFDGYADNKLIEAKYYLDNGSFTRGANEFMNNPNSRFAERWYDRATSDLKQAEDQLATAGNVEIEWRVAGEQAAELLQQMFNAHNLPINVVYFP
jgi:hypothetical protein